MAHDRPDRLHTALLLALHSRAFHRAGRIQRLLERLRLRRETPAQWEKPRAGLAASRKMRHITTRR